LQFWEDLEPFERTQLYNELVDLDLDDVVESFQRCLKFAEDEGKKLDDKVKISKVQFRKSFLNLNFLYPRCLLYLQEFVAQP
jgi:hypothetical protein